MFKAAFQGLILHVHVAHDPVRRIDFRFHFWVTAYFVSPYITMGSEGNTLLTDYRPLTHYCVMYVKFLRQLQ